MTTRFNIGEITVDRIVECEYPYARALDFLPSLTPDRLAENRSWMQPMALDDRDWLVFCFQSYVLRTPHHTILVGYMLG
jgi:hypothetical protein